MNRNIIAALIIAVGLVLAAFLFTGRYYVLRVNADTVVRVDRWTGETKEIKTGGPTTGWEYLPSLDRPR